MARASTDTSRRPRGHGSGLRDEPPPRVDCDGGRSIGLDAARSQRAGALTGRVRHFFRGESIRNAPSCFVSRSSVAALMLAAVPASAQYGASVCRIRRPARATTWRSPERCSTRRRPCSSPARGSASRATRSISSKEFGLEKKTFKQLRVVLRPGRKHKLRYEFIPISYEKETTISRSFVFNGQRFNVSLPVLAELKWNAMRFSYECDFIYTDRGYRRPGARPEVHRRRGGADQRR